MRCTIIRMVELGLRFIGMWPDSAYPNLYSSLYVTMIMIVQYYQYSYVIAHFDLSNLSVLMDSLSFALTNTCAALKVLFLLWNRRVFHNMLTMMDKDWSECIVNDSYGSTMKTVRSLSRCYSIVLIGLAALTGFFVTVGAYVGYNINNEGPREFPVRMEFTFEANKSPVFECILFGQFFYVFSLGSLVGIINSLLISLVLHVGGQIDVMRQAIKEISNSNDSDKSFIVIRNLIYRHRNIITLSQNIECLFSSISLLQFLWNTLIICFSGFMTITALSSHKGKSALIKSGLFYMTKSLEVFVFCYAGEYLTAKSKSIGDAIYESNWYNLIPSHSRDLLFIMVRSQKRLTITAGKIIDLTLEGFMSVMKASASYMSVLHAMY